MVDAKAIVVYLAREVISVGKCSTVVMLDVANAFNTTNWGWIQDTFAKLGFPGYLAPLIESYLLKQTSDRKSRMCVNDSRCSSKIRMGALALECAWPSYG